MVCTRGKGTELERANAAHQNVHAPFARSLALDRCVLVINSLLATIAATGFFNPLPCALQGSQEGACKLRGDPRDAPPFNGSFHDSVCVWIPLFLCLSANALFSLLPLGSPRSPGGACGARVRLCE